MKICISELTFNSFEDVFNESLIKEDILLLNREGKLSKGEGHPEVVFISYEIMFKMLRDPVYKNNFLKLIDGCSFIQASWAGIESEEAKELIKIPDLFSHGGGVHAITIGTYVFAQILRKVKDIDAHIELQKNKEWKQMTSVAELTDMVLGVAGYGGIGQEVARLGKAFRMEVLATKRTPVSSDNLDRLYKPSDLNEMLSHCDFVVNCLPVTKDTLKAFSLEQFKAMKSSSMFINVGRGETVSEDDLHEALTSGEIECAALDVTDPEPLDKNSPLWELENCFITPHDSAWGPRAPERAVELFLLNLERYKKGDKLQNLV
jgi:phosphoglycerate dehydrogenase-like enzyme